MKLDELRPAPGAGHRRKIVGRGPGSGHGKTAGKGNKGHNARSGGGKAGGFEGGQMPLYRRLPKRGFFPYGGKTEYAVVNLKALGGFAVNAVVDPDALAEAGLIKRRDRSRVKVLGAGDVAHGLTVKAHAVSASARAKIEAKGGRVEVLGAPVDAS
ncbi:MAG: 50S ribosomal protein L15 [Candidatus Rokuibacteriota bacterium]|jgi:large subunit ribosomal protein L15|nr:MAG: 50S ribosomal protein L15 [Candidatus Rokubacteria bacterium 13_2_20CM_2_70_11]PYM39558.1 MAG: 50S ribosomal protein L15 [Candidatus Rokubacteria bacterium]PYN37104.1 MAG: 50S ribosomal protein L15 [Candidatus Rokubacteria bacterium]